jgi:hypothetical protein
MRQLIRSFFLVLPILLSFSAGQAQKTIAHDDEWPKSTAKPDLSIVSVSVVYPTASQAPTLTTPRGTVQGNPSSASANPITRCTVVIKVDSNADDQVMLDVTLPVGVKIQDKPANATTGPCADYKMQCDGAIHILLGHLEPGKPVTTSFSYTTPPTGGSLRNEVLVSVKGEKPESNVSNNSRSASLRP